MNHPINGACLCGAVKVTGTVEREEFDACHCGMCRKWSGGPLMTLHARDVEFRGKEFIGDYASSEWAERGFCTQCGTHLFYRFKAGDSYALPLGLLDNTEDFTFHLQIFVDRQPGNYRFANETEMMTEAEVFAKYMS